MTTCSHMKTMQLRDAKAKLSALVDAAERGEATTITRHGRPAAVVVPVPQAEKAPAKRKPSFAEQLLSIPESIDIERDQTPMRSIDL